MKGIRKFISPGSDDSLSGLTSSELRQREDYLMEELNFLRGATAPRATEDSSHADTDRFLHDSYH